MTLSKDVARLVKDLKETSLKVKNYKCFGPELEGFDRIMPMNVVIGRNNSGKSALIDILEAVISGVIPPESMSRPETVIEGSQLMNQIDSQHGFNVNHMQNHISETHRNELRVNAIGKKLLWFQTRGAPRRFQATGLAMKDWMEELFGSVLFKNKDWAIGKLQFAKIGAERNILPEEKARNKYPVAPNGDNATCLIEQVLHDTQHPRELIRDTLLTELNVIFQPDSQFVEIDCRFDEALNKWEVYLYEENKGGVPLSRMGSGVKTLLLVLLHLHVLPVITKKTNLSTYAFAFEELENNLHPALQRRLFDYLFRFAKENGCTFFIATHSPVVIDQFAGEEEAQIIHVTHDGKFGTVRSTATYADHISVLADLEVKASDLLQTNCVVWVEGPSDRIYFNRWMQLAYDGKLNEGIHYNCLSYGGRLLAGMSAEFPDEVATELIGLLKINANAVVLMDRDCKNAASVLGDSKSRIISELKQCNGRVWVTEQREIEHYIPSAILKAEFNTASSLTQYQSFEQYYKSATGKQSKPDKVKIALSVAAKLKLDDMATTGDWAAHIVDIGEYIGRKNLLRPLPTFVG